MSIHSRRLAWVSVVALAASSLLWVASSCCAGPTVTVGADVPAGSRVPLADVDHKAWDALLKRYVDQRGNVDYGGWKAARADVEALDAYLRSLSRVSLAGGAERAQVLAFWINAYNAVTVRGILREYPTTSIRNHTAKAFGYNIWRDLLLPVDGQAYSLEKIEHQVLRKMREPRIHFAIVCASVGCPPLLNEAYVPDRLENQLADNTRAFFAEPTKSTFDAARNTLHVSPILEWFAEDFGASDAERLKFVADFLPDAASRRAAANGSAKLAYLTYDWGLNDRARSGR